MLGCVDNILSTITEIFHVTVIHLVYFLQSHPVCISWRAICPHMQNRNFTMHFWLQVTKCHSLDWMDMPALCSYICIYTMAVPSACLFSQQLAFKLWALHAAHLLHNQSGSKAPGDTNAGPGGQWRANPQSHPRLSSLTWYTVHHRACMQQLSVWGRGALEVLRPPSIRRFTVPTRAK